MLDLGIYIIISALVGAKLLLLVVDFDTFSEDPAELLTLLRSGGVFYGGLIVAVVGRALVHAPAPPAAVDRQRRVRARHRARPRRRPARLPLRRLLLRQADDRAVGDHVSPIRRRAERRHAAERPAAPDAALRGRRRAADSGIPARHRTQGARRFPAARSGSTCCSTAISRFIIEFYRGDPRGTVVDMFSTSQFISLILVPLALVMLIVLGARRRPVAGGAERRARAALGGPR